MLVTISVQYSSAQVLATIHHRDASYMDLEMRTGFTVYHMWVDKLGLVYICCQLYFVH